MELDFSKPMEQQYEWSDSGLRLLKEIQFEVTLKGGIHAVYHLVAIENTKSHIAVAFHSKRLNQISKKTYRDNKPHFSNAEVHFIILNIGMKRKLLGAILRRSASSITVKIHMINKSRKEAALQTA
jgi:hypothetical protein